MKILLDEIMQIPKSSKDCLEKNKNITFPLGTPLKEIQAHMIKEALDFTDQNINLSAKLLGINSRTIYRYLEK